MGQRTRRQARCLLQTAAAVFIAHPTERASMAQGPFLVGPAQGRSPYAPPWPQIPSAPSAFPLLGAPSNNPPEGCKSLGYGPLRLEEISSCRDTLGQIRAAASTADRSASQKVEWRSVITAAAVFVARPT